MKSPTTPQELISQYKQLIQKYGFKDEVYKWELLQKYQGIPNLEATDFTAELKKIDFSNLVYQNAITVIKTLADNAPETYRACLKILFDEQVDLASRMMTVKTKVDQLYTQVKPDLKHNHDERTIATLLTYQYPERYTIYKYQYYEAFCHLMKVKVENNFPQKYVHYLTLVDDLVENFIKKDAELMALIAEHLPKVFFDTKNYRLIAQDALFRFFGTSFKFNKTSFDFEKTIKKFEILLKKDKGTLKKFSIINSNFKSQKKGIGNFEWIWIKDSQNIIGNKKAHYELWYDDKEQVIYIDLHFESEYQAEKDIFYKKIKTLPNGLAWRDWQHSKSIKIIDHVDMQIGNIPEVLLEKIAFLEKNIGEKVRAIMTDKDVVDAEKNYWLYAPSTAGSQWDNFYKEGIMSLGWDELGNLKDYSTGDLRKKLQQIDSLGGLKYNDLVANESFRDKLQIGDCIIVKRGTKHLLGYGFVTSEYIFDDKKTAFKSYRKVDWRLKGTWQTEFSLVIKRFTDITKYDEDKHSLHKKYYEKLLAIMTDKNYQPASNIDNDIPKNQILFGPPGTGKTYHTVNKALSIIENKTEEELQTESRSELKSRFNEHIQSGQIVFTTFHQSMSYEDFVEGIKPLEPKEEGDNLIYKVESGIFKKICSEARKKIKQVILTDDEETELTPELFKIYYEEFAEQLPLHTDTLSRFQLRTRAKNIVFDLFRNTKNSIVVKTGKERTKITLSLSELTKVKFEEKIPFYNSYTRPVIDEILKHTGVKDQEVRNETKNFVLIIDEINRGNVSSIFGELITLLEKDKRIGQSEALKVVLPYSKDKFGVPNNLYLIGTMNTADRSVEALDSALRRRFSFTEMPPRPDVIQKNDALENGKLGRIDLVEVLKVINQRIEILLDKDHLIGHSYFMAIEELEDLKKAFSEKIIPLLQEYFYGDYGKIALVLGEGFCKEKTKSTRPSNLFAKVKNYDSDAYSDKVIYEITDIFSADFDIENAIDLLLNKIK